MRRLLTILILLLVLFGAAGVWSAYTKERESAALRVQSQGALADLTQQQSHLEANITDLESERGREAALRQQYAVGEKGEHLVIIIDPASTTPTEATTTMFQKIEQAFWWW
jgi:cell division protein FtsB